MSHTSWAARMRLGLFGGTFDPIHMGHLVLAESCREACALEKVWFVVAGAPPHKKGERTSVQDRLEMVRIAIAGNAAFEVSEIEARRPGPHYSVITLEQVHAERPKDALFFLIGADSLRDLPTWREPERIAALATIVVVDRPGIDPAVLDDLPDFGPGTNPCQIVRVPPIGISSTDLRQRLAEGRGVRYQVPRGVEAYIRARGLYKAR